MVRVGYCARFTEGRDYMKKNIILKIVSIVLALIAILACICAITVTGSGLLDLSNIVRAVCIGVVVVCGVLAVLTWKSSKTRD